MDGRIFERLFTGIFQGAVRRRILLTFRFLPRARRLLIDRRRLRFDFILRPRFVGSRGAEMTL